MKKPLTIGYLTVDDATDRRSWSGINYFLMRALEQRGVQVVLLGPLRPQPLLFICQVLNQITLRLLGKRFHYRDSFVLSRAYSRIVHRRIRRRSLDLILAPAGLSAVALLRTSVPIVHFNDRCVAGALDYHAILKGLLRWSLEQSLELERRALANASLNVYTSEWAADAARKALPSAAHKVVTIPMGANLERIPDPPAEVPFPPDRLKLLMVGVDWTNKGGPIAYAALKELKRRGHNVELVVCGCTPPPECDDPDLSREGFLSKSDPADAAKLLAHFRSAHFMVLPTRFEAYGIAFCEAAAYGLPALGTRTGGVPTIVQEGVTGFLFAPEATGLDYADRIEEMLNDPARWQRMRSAARERYERVFTWDAFVTALLDQLSPLVGTSNAR